MTLKDYYVQAEGDAITFRYPRGKMRLHMGRFFPTTSANVRTLIKTIDLNDDPGRRYIITEILRWVRQASDEVKKEEGGKRLADTSIQLEAEADEMQGGIDELSHVLGRAKEEINLMPRGDGKKEARERLKEGKERLAQLKYSQRALRKEAKEKREEFKEVQRRSRKLNENIELIERLTADWSIYE